jgi:3-methyladenine DNA glycosylase AlkD
LDERNVQYGDVLEKLKSMRNREAVEGMARYGINPKNNYGVSVRNLREIAKKIGTDHELALQLWSSGIHDARILASMIDDPGVVTEEQMDGWAGDFDSWDVCDETCNNLFSKTQYARTKAMEWSKRNEVFVKRAGFVMMANLAVHDKNGGKAEFVTFLDLIVTGAKDERNYVKKAVNWSLRQVGKRNRVLNKAAIKAAKDILKLNSKSSKWIASDALLELTSDKIRKKLGY